MSEARARVVVVAAQELDRFCREQAAYRWICGGVSVNTHTISDFRRNNVETFRKVLVSGVAVLIQHGIVDLGRIAQDGMRGRVSAGAASFRRWLTLEQRLAAAEAHIKEVRESGEDDATATPRQRAVRIGAAEDRQARIREALRRLPEIEAKKKNREVGNQRRDLNRR